MKLFLFICFLFFVPTLYAQQASVGLFRSGSNDGLVIKYTQIVKKNEFNMGYIIPIQLFQTSYKAFLPHQGLKSNLLNFELGYSRKLVQSKKLELKAESNMIIGKRVGETFLRNEIEPIFYMDINIFPALEWFISRKISVVCQSGLSSDFIRLPYFRMNSPFGRTISKYKLNTGNFGLFANLEVRYSFCKEKKQKKILED